MALSADDVVFIKTGLAFVYADLWAKHRGLLHVLGEHGVVLTEQTEREIEAWVDHERENVWREAGLRLKRFFELPPA